MSQAYQSSLLPHSGSPSRDAFLCRIAPARMFGMALLSVLMTLGAAYCTTVPTIKGQIGGWGGLFFFGACTVYMLWNISNREPMLVIDAHGIDYRRLSIGVVPWEDVIDVGVGEIRGQRFLCISVRDEAAYRARLGIMKKMLAAANRGLGFPLVSISFTGTDQSIETALSAIERFRPA